MAQGFESLECWKACFKLKEWISLQLLPKLPKSERYELYAQLLRAARSTTANIAEGYGRYHYKDSVRFLIHARGSISEILDHGIEALACNYIDQSFLNELRLQSDTCMRLVNGYIKYLRNQDDKGNRG